MGFFAIPVGERGFGWAGAAGALVPGMTHWGRCALPLPPAGTDADSPGGFALPNAGDAAKRRLHRSPCSPARAFRLMRFCLQGEGEFNVILKNLVLERCKCLLIQMIMSIIHLTIFRHL